MTNTLIDPGGSEAYPIFICNSYCWKWLGRLISKKPPSAYSEGSDDAKPLQIRRKLITRTLNTATSSGSNIEKDVQHIPGNGRSRGSNNMDAAPIIASQSQSQPIPTKIADFETLQFTSPSLNIIERTISTPATGCSTTLAISIFSDAPLPAGRQIWLQERGYSANTGMRLKALVGDNGGWLNVTPAISLSADQLDEFESDERVRQRNIRKFLKNTIHAKHILRETLVVCIPVEASDGSFHLVLCPGEKKKVACSNPVFRVLPASTNPSSLRGASLSTLPLELGAMAMTAYANNSIGRVISPATSAADIFA
ncbi:hypothetical protein DSL72_005440 [Monilinia vaccinii-corymbosi]|uniref:Uncharacterized protein n=1 Tax=Monilinia vaccinii-corymbosi TaxID=61207 RepID=A0A8A3PF65_9HELO|nr:hypothetical protein DSL72_005440 [Monilinia vaccinii-corymbosi]